MKNMYKQRLLALLLIMCVAFGGCAAIPGVSATETPTMAPIQTDAPAEITPSPTPEPSPVASATPTTEAETPSEPVVSQTPDVSEKPSGPAFDYSQIPAWDGVTPWVAVNGNVPYLLDEGLPSATSFERYSTLDALGRCGAAVACIGADLMPAGDRGDISSVQPSGWHSVPADNVDGGYVYNRCHLIGYQLTAENANPLNLITGTRFLNVQGMLPFENMVADYVKETGNHVLYRATPVFIGDELLARGVLMEAVSVEDAGESILFNVFVYNAQPGIGLNYATGEVEGMLPSPSEEAPEPSMSPTEPPTPEPQITPAPQITPEPPAPVGGEFVLNTNTKKFHLPSCSSVKQIKPANRQDVGMSRSEIIAQGYVPCKKCNP